MGKVIDIATRQVLDPQDIAPAGEVVVYARFSEEVTARLPLPSQLFQQVMGQAVRNAGYVPVFVDEMHYDQAHQAITTGEAAGLVVVMPEDNSVDEVMSGSVKMANGTAGLLAIAASLGSKVAVFGTSNRAHEIASAVEAHEAHFWPKDSWERVIGSQVLDWLGVATPEQLPAS